MEREPKAANNKLPDIVVRFNREALMRRTSSSRATKKFYPRRKSFSKIALKRGLDAARQFNLPIDRINIDPGGGVSLVIGTGKDSGDDPTATINEQQLKELI
jgi:hypothetical protein